MKKQSKGLIKVRFSNVQDLGIEVDSGHEGGFGECRFYRIYKVGGLYYKKYFPSWTKSGELEFIGTGWR